MVNIKSQFVKSPFKRTVRHAKKVEECSCLMRECIQAFCDGDFEKVEELVIEISKVERSADEIKIDIRASLPKRIFMPVERGDFLGYLKEEDRIADKAEEIALAITLKKTTLPKEVTKDLIRLGPKIFYLGQIIPPAVDSMEKVATSVFAKKEKEKVVGYALQLSLMERETDHICAKLRKGAFKVESKLSYGEFYQLMQIIKLMGWMADHVENCGDRLRMMTARY